MSRWVKNYVVPLESLIKEKENTNRPVAARSAGTVGKWGKMGFTSTRTYALKTLPATIKSPDQSPPTGECQLTATTATIPTAEAHEQPKPKKFFKSRNALPDLMITTQIIHHLPRAPPSPIRNEVPIIKKDIPLKMKIPKRPRERKKSLSEKPVKVKKKKEKKKIKPEAPPTRRISRTRKVVNYNEEDDEGSQTPIRDLILLKSMEESEKLAKSEQIAEIEKMKELKKIVELDKVAESKEVGEPEDMELEEEMELEEPQEIVEAEKVMEPPPTVISKPLPVEQPSKPLPLEQTDNKSPSVEHPSKPSLIEHPSKPPPVEPLSKPPSVEHPPIVLRISKGTSRLISTDSEDVLNSPTHEQHIQTEAPIKTATELAAVLKNNSKFIQNYDGQNKHIQNNMLNAVEEKPKENISENIPMEENTESIKETKIIEHVETLPVIEAPPKHESLKIVIKTDVIKNSIEKSERRKKKHHKSSNLRIIEHQFKTPSPQPGSENYELYRALVTSPSDRDFDSQSSILGSVSSKETVATTTATTTTPTNQFATAIPEDNCVVRSRGSSDITSDLETSQHSSLVAPPSDIESRLESMMDCEDEELPQSNNVAAAETTAEIIENNDYAQAISEEPLVEDILQVLTGDIESELTDKIDEPQIKADDTTESEVKTNVAAEPEVKKDDEMVEHESKTDESIKPDTKLDEITEPEPVEDGLAVVKEKAPEEKKTRSRRPKKDEVPETLIEEPVKIVGRVTRNNTNNGNLKNKKSSPPPPVKSYSRKRKATQAITKPKLPVLSSPDDINNIQSTTNIDLSDAPTLNAKVLRSSEKIDTVDNQVSQKKASNEKEYKIKNKNKAKRTWYERDAKNNHEQKHDLRQQTTKNNTINNSVHNLSSKDNLKTNNIVNNNNGDCNAPGNKDEGKPSVKLVISTKKGSIFKSRVADQDSKKRHLYKHTWDADDENECKSIVSDGKTTPTSTNESMYNDFSEIESTSRLTRVTRQNAGKFADENITSVKCDKKAKDYYTVVRNVKTAHQIQEIGEYQEMDDDVEYILDVLQPHNPITTRCLSAIQLASKCMTPAFRMHVRAHGIVTKFFKALKDARKDLSLSLCTATIMFVLSQDTLNMDLDRDSLELMMNLLEADASSPLDECGLTYFERNKQKVKEICEEIKSQGKAAHLNMDSISTGTLAMETLLSLTSKRAGEWFKEELRELGGLEHIIKTICECCHQISDYVVNWTDVLLDKLRTIERCLRVLENVSQQNERNQEYILSYSDGHAINTLVKLYKLCDSEIALYPTTDATPKENPGVVLREALLPTLKVLINLTHPFNDDARGSSILGARDGIFDTSFHILLQAPNYIPERCIFELSILVLLFLINLTMHTIPNRILIMQSHAPSDFGNQFDKVPAIKALIEYFYKCEEQARMVEKNTDAILDNPDKNKKKLTSQEEVNETVTKLLQKAGHHMEHTMKASYAGILIGHLVSGSQDNEKKIRSYLKDGSFNDIVSVLEKYYNFMNLTASSEATVVSHIKQTKKLIDYLKKCDLHSNSGSDGTDKNSDQLMEQKKNSPMTTRNTPRIYKTYSQR